MTFLKDTWKTFKEMPKSPVFWQIWGLACVMIVHNWWYTGVMAFISILWSIVAHGCGYNQGRAEMLDHFEHFLRPQREDW